MKTIIAATDFSSTANNAVTYAAQLAQQYQAKLVLFNAFTPPVHSANTWLTTAEFQRLLEASAAKLKSTADLMAKTYQIETECESVYSSVGQQLKKLAKKHQADVVVFGMKPRTLEQFLLGSRTLNAIAKMRFPVLAVPPAARFNGLNHVLFACDLLQGVSEKILSRIQELAKPINADVEIFYVEKKIAELKKQGIGLQDNLAIENGLEGINYSYKSVQSNAIIQIIKQEIIDYHADLLIMTPRKHGFWSSIVHKSKTHVMALKLSVPLLSIPS